MFGNLINRILGLEMDSPATGCQETVTVLDVTEKAVSPEPTSERCRTEIGTLQERYGKLSSLTGFELPLKEALLIMPKV